MTLSWGTLWVYYALYELFTEKLFEPNFKWNEGAKHTGIGDWKESIVGRAYSTCAGSQAWPNVVYSGNETKASVIGTSQVGFVQDEVTPEDFTMATLYRQLFP